MFSTILLLASSSLAPQAQTPTQIQVFPSAQHPLPPIVVSDDPDDEVQMIENLDEDGEMGDVDDLSDAEMSSGVAGYSGESLEPQQGTAPQTSPLPHQSLRGFNFRGVHDPRNQQQQETDPQAIPLYSGIQDGFTYHTFTGGDGQQQIVVQGPGGGEPVVMQNDPKNPIKVYSWSGSLPSPMYKVEASSRSPYTFMLPSQEPSKTSAPALQDDERRALEQRIETLERRLRERDGMGQQGGGNNLAPAQRGNGAETLYQRAIEEQARAEAERAHAAEGQSRTLEDRVRQLEQEITKHQQHAESLLNRPEIQDALRRAEEMQQGSRTDAVRLRDALDHFHGHSVDTTPMAPFATQPPQPPKPAQPVQPPARAPRGIGFVRVPNAPNTPMARMPGMAPRARPDGELPPEHSAPPGMGDTPMPEQNEVLDRRPEPDHARSDADRMRREATEQRMRTLKDQMRALKDQMDQLRSELEREVQEERAR